jgi:hypothetical protein
VDVQLLFVAKSATQAAHAVDHCLVQLHAVFLVIALRPDIPVRSVYPLARVMEQAAYQFAGCVSSGM